MNDLFPDDPAHEAEPESGPGSGGATSRAERRRREQQRKRRRRTALTVLLMVGLFAGMVTAVVLVGPSIIEGLGPQEPEDYPGPGSGTVTVEIAEGANGGEIADTLLDAGVVASREAFVDAFNANPGATSIQAGAYTLMEQMPAADAVAALLNPANRAEVKLTIPEGLRASQIYERIASVTGVPVADVEAAAADTAAIGLPAEAGGNVEGWLAPATYTIQKGTTSQEILAEMITARVGELDARAVPAELRQQVLTKASIVEKEVNTHEDFGKVARVIENRLLPDSPTAGTLGMDSTLAYGLGKSGLELTRSDLESDHPYNTRVHAGLPPGPICSPGTDAIDAVLNPPAGDWVYFVTVNPDTGETRFTASYEEHLANQALYRQWLEQHATDGATEGGG